jgi:hypothetical protein
MKTILALVLVLTLGGCKYLEPITRDVANPVTTKDLYNVEQTMVIVASALNTYKGLCVRKQIDQKCRDVIIQAQSFTRPAAAMLPRLRVYVKTNDRLNAINAYNTLVGLIADARSVAQTNGVSVP